MKMGLQYPKEVGILLNDLCFNSNDVIPRSNVVPKCDVISVGSLSMSWMILRSITGTQLKHSLLLMLPIAILHFYNALPCHTIYNFCQLFVIRLESHLKEDVPFLSDKSILSVHCLVRSRRITLNHSVYVTNQK